LSNFIRVNPAVAVLVNHVESVHQVEVRLAGQAHLCLVNTRLQAHQFTERSDKLLLFRVPEGGSLLAAARLKLLLGSRVLHTAAVPLGLLLVG